MFLIRHLFFPPSLSGPGSQPHRGPAGGREKQQNSQDPEPRGPGPGPREPDPGHCLHRGRGLLRRFCRQLNLPYDRVKKKSCLHGIIPRALKHVIWKVLSKVSK